MFNLFKHKSRIVPFNTLSNNEKELLEKFRELTPENKSRILLFAKESVSPQEKPTGKRKLYFIWDHLL